MAGLKLAPTGESDEEKLLFIEQMIANCDKVQQQVLEEILTQNGGTEYLRRHGLDGATDRASFKSKIPVITYEDLRPDILRIANGEDSAILSGQPITEFLISSGTSGGEMKLIPAIEQDFDRRRLFYSLFMPITKQYVKGQDNGRVMYFTLVKPDNQTPAGLPYLTVTSSDYKKNLQLHQPSNFYKVFTSPPDAVLCPDTHQSMYIQMLCGLLRRLEVNQIGTTFASGLVRAIHFLKTNWSQLAQDIATGTLCPSITHPSLRASVADLLRPNPDLASLIINECSKSDWSGIITRIWPNAKHLTAIITGTLSQYISTLELYGGGIPIASFLYSSTECCAAINLNPICPPSEVTYTFMPNMGYFEFLAEGEEPNLVDLADVKVGKEYELVVTNYAGLFRYRVGDVFQVSKFINTSPQFKFMRRKNVLLSIGAADRTNEIELQQAVESGVEQLLAAFGGASLVDYTSKVCTETVPGHYAIYWEVLWQGEERSSELGAVMERCCLAMEEELNAFYKYSRVDGSIGPLEIRVIQAGTFEEVMELAISKGASINQYKMPRCVNSKPTLDLLDSRVVSSHFSPNLPRWSLHNSN